MYRFFHRSAPSGGCRHPIETYLIAKDVIGVPDGVYHINITSFKLSKVSDISQDNTLSKCGGFLVFTAVFSRNMYRYREARTFRAVHMDAGHLIEINRALLARAGFKTRISFSGMHYFEKLVRIDGLSEGYMGSILFEEGTPTI